VQSAAADTAAGATRRAGWDLAVDGRAFVGWVHESTFKGGTRAGAANWLSLEASRQAARRSLKLTVMGSLETVTWGDCGYPRLLAGGTACARDGFREYQTPHPPLMQLSGGWEQQTASGPVLGLTVALVGEPALGPPMYVHRESAAPDPVAPITHHDMNPAHASAGVLTAGMKSRTWSLEASVFNGEPPDADRVVPRYREMRSAAARLALEPRPGWSVQASLGRLRSRAAHHAGASAALNLATASAAHTWSGERWSGAATLAWARMNDGALVRHSLLLEATTTLASRYTWFARAEAAHRADIRGAAIVDTGDGQHEHRVVTARAGVAQFSTGITAEYRALGAAMGIGARGSLSLLPPALRSLYGASWPAGAAVFASLRPARPPGGHAVH